MSAWFDRFGFGRIDAQLLSGSMPADAGDVAQLRAAGVTAVVNLCDELEYDEGEYEDVAAAYAASGITETRLPTEDHGHLLPGLLERATDAVLARMGAGDVVYVHCRAGWQRSATVAAATLARRDDLTLDDALDVVRRGRPDADPLPHQREDLRTWWRLRRARDG